MCLWSFSDSYDEDKSTQPNTKLQPIQFHITISLTLYAICMHGFIAAPGHLRTWLHLILEPSNGFGDCVRDSTFCRSMFYGVSFKIIFARYLWPEYLHTLCLAFFLLLLLFFPVVFVHSLDSCCKLLRICGLTQWRIKTQTEHYSEMQTRWANSDQLIRENHCQMVNV